MSHGARDVQAGLELRRVERRLQPPLVNANGSWTERESLMVGWGAASGGPRGHGEAAPLPDYSFDTLAGAERALAAVSTTQLEALADTADAGALLDAVAALIPPQQPSARFALETTVLDRAARRASQPLWRLLASFVEEATGSRAPDRDGANAVALCALLPSDRPEAALALARQRMSQGVSVFKLKIGPDRLQPDQEATLDVLRRQLGAAVTLRADANGSLSRAKLAVTLKRLEAFSIEFLEEPIADAEPEELADSPCPLALDESLQRVSPERLSSWLQLDVVRVVVLKPTPLGGFGRCIRLAALARVHGCDAVVSHALEGPVGWSACAHLALALPSARAAGLWPLTHQSAAVPAVSHGHLVRPSEPGLGVSA